MYFPRIFSLRVFSRMYLLKSLVWLSAGSERLRSFTFMATEIPILVLGFGGMWVRLRQSLAVSHIHITVVQQE